MVGQASYKLGRIRVRDEQVLFLFYMILDQNLPPPKNSTPIILQGRHLRLLHPHLFPVRPATIEKQMRSCPTSTAQQPREHCLVLRHCCFEAEFWPLGRPLPPSLTRIHLQLWSPPLWVDSVYSCASDFCRSRSPPSQGHYSAVSLCTFY